MSTTPALHGLHHVTAVTADATANLDFYTRLLGMRLVKKTVNQDDTGSYHLFYADALGSPGTELTFFEWPHAPKANAGAGFATEMALRVLGGTETLERWRAHFAANGIAHQEIETDSASLAFSDPEGQKLRLIAETSDREVHPWRGSPVPPEAAIIGLAGVTLHVREVETTARFLLDVLGFQRLSESLFRVGTSQLWLLPSTAHGSPGAGGVHHLAWAVTAREDQQAWLQHLAAHGVSSSGLVDRFYFQSVYFRIPGGILFELATESPGFTADGERLDQLGERLSLPPFLEKSRASIEARLRPLPFSAA